jgi:hypothetical protein
MVDAACTEIKLRYIKMAKTLSQYDPTEYNFGIEVPNMVQQALGIDDENGTKLWMNGKRNECHTSNSEESR